MHTQVNEKLHKIGDLLAQSLLTLLLTALTSGEDFAINCGT